MLTAEEKIQDLIGQLEKTAEREISIWPLLIPGRDSWRLFSEYRDFCTQEQTVIAFITAAQMQVSRFPGPGRRDLSGRIAKVEQRVRTEGAAVHRRYLHALSEPGVPLPLGSHSFLRQRIAEIETMLCSGTRDLRQSLRDLAGNLAGRAHELRDFGGRA